MGIYENIVTKMITAKIIKIKNILPTYLTISVKIRSFTAFQNLLEKIMETNHIINTMANIIIVMKIIFDI